MPLSKNNQFNTRDIQIQEKRSVLVMLFGRESFVLARLARRYQFLSFLVAAWALTVQSPLCQADDPPKLPLGLPKVVHPKSNSPSAKKIELGRQLYFDKRLSADNTISCASCHDPKKGYSNGEQFATGVGGKKGGRNSPTTINVAYNRFQFWDGRSPSLEDQALGPIQNPIEMNMKLADVVKKLNAISGYQSQFQEIFKTDVTEQGIGQAIAAFERTILSGNAPEDRYKSGDKKALSEQALLGRALFFGRAACSSCHTGSNFTDNAFHNVGIGMNAKEIDKGREVISKLEGDRGSFKTPTLREIAKSGPYMHDGSLKTLEEVIEHYDKGGIANDYLDEEIFPLKLTEEEKKNLVVFLKEGLSSSTYPLISAPKLPE